MRTALENGEGVLYKEATKRLEWRRTKIMELMSKGENEPIRDSTNIAGRQIHYIQGF